jgi:hypothetical protein
MSSQKPPNSTPRSPTLTLTLQRREAPFSRQHRHRSAARMGRLEQPEIVSLSYCAEAASGGALSFTISAATAAAFDRPRPVGTAARTCDAASIP